MTTPKGRTLEDLGGEAEDVVDEQDDLLGVLGAGGVGLEAGQLGVVTLGGVLDLDGRELAAVRGGWREG